MGEGDEEGRGKNCSICIYVCTYVCLCAEYLPITQ